MGVVQVTDNTFENEVLKSEVPVLVDFWAPWCGPCRMIAPVVEQIGSEQGGKLKVAKVNTDENTRFAIQYGVTGIPCLIFFKNGQEAGRLVGFMPKEQIDRKVKEVVGS